MNRLLAIVAYLVLAGFLVILAYKVPEPDLIIVIALTLVLAGWDLATSSGRNN